MSCSTRAPDGVGDDSVAVRRLTYRTPPLSGAACVRSFVQ